MRQWKLTDLEGTGIPSPSPREKSLGWLATKQLDEAEDAACNPDLASSRPGAVTSANDPLYVDRVQRARSELAAPARMLPSSALIDSPSPSPLHARKTSLTVDVPSTPAGAAPSSRRARRRAVVVVRRRDDAGAGVVVGRRRRRAGRFGP